MSNLDEQLPASEQLHLHQKASRQLPGPESLAPEPDPGHIPNQPPRLPRQSSTASTERGHDPPSRFSCQTSTASTEQDSRARRRPALQNLRRLQSALSSGRQGSANNSPREVRFISPAPSAFPADFPYPSLPPPLHPQPELHAGVGLMQDAPSDVESDQEMSQQPPPTSPVPALARGMKQSLKPSLRRRSFNRQASNVSFAPTVSGGSDSSNDEDTTHERRNMFTRSFVQPGLAVSPVLRTVSSVWQAIISMGRKGETDLVPPPLYQPARPNSPDGDRIPPYADAPHMDPPASPSPTFRAQAAHHGRPPRSASSLWQIASHKAGARLTHDSAADSPATSASHGQPPSRFGSFWGAVAQAAVKQPIPARQATNPRALGQEHLALGVQLLLQARQHPTRVNSNGARGAGQQGSGLGARGRQPSLANVVRALSTTWHLDQAASMDPESQVCT